jgi:hypothetical protein
VPLPPEPVDAPDGRSYVVRTYRSGTLTGRFPSAGGPAPAALLVIPLALVGWLLHLLVYRQSWTVAVTPWHNLPGPRHRERVPSRDAAAARVIELEAAVQSGTWAS